MACLPFFLSFLPPFFVLLPCVCPAFMLFAFPLLSLSFFALVVFCCPLVLSFLSGFVFGVAFSLSVYTQKERAQFLASSLVLLWLRWLLCVCQLFAGFLPYLFGFFVIQSATVPMLAARAKIEAI